MVSYIGRRQKSHLTMVKKILSEAKVPQRWYSIDEPIDNRVCVTLEQDGLHVFIPERGERTGENVHQEWYDAILDIANCLEYQYTQCVTAIARRKRRDELISNISSKADIHHSQQKDVRSALLPHDANSSNATQVSAHDMACAAMPITVVKVAGNTSGRKRVRAVPSAKLCKVRAAKYTKKKR